MPRKTYTTALGDEWDSIALSQLDSEFHLSVLMRANREHIGTVIFSAGVELNLPEVPEEVADTLPPWRRNAR